MLRKSGDRSPSNPEFDLEAPGSRFTMRPALAVQVGHEWMDRSERESGVAPRAVGAELGSEWATDDLDLGEIRVLDGVRGRGAAAWIPVLEWLGVQVASGVVSFGAGQAVGAGIRRVWAKIKEARAADHAVMVSRGLAAMLAMEHVFETTDETGVLQVEFAEEPSLMAGRPMTETSYTGIEPWVVSLVNEPRRTRYLLTISPEGGIEGCLATPMGAFEAMYSPLPPVE